MIRAVISLCLAALPLPLGLAAAETAAPAAPTLSPPTLVVEDSATILPFDLDASRRMTVEVMVDGAGPYGFVVDTGAERTVLSQELATRLALPAGPTLTLATISGRARTASARVGQLTAASLRLDALEAPLLPGRHLGAAGLIGIDGLAKARVTFNFREGHLRLSSAGRAPPPAPSGYSSGDEIVVTAQRKGGRLVVHDAWIAGGRVDLIIDTGAVRSIGNLALRDRLRRKRGDVRFVEVVSVSGGKLIAEMGVVPSVRLDSITLKDVPVAFADSPVFDTLDLAQRPALLLGMDMMELFDQVEIDFARRRVVFWLPRQVARDPRERWALSRRLPAG